MRDLKNSKTGVVLYIYTRYNWVLFIIYIHKTPQIYCFLIIIYFHLQSFIFYDLIVIES